MSHADDYIRFIALVDRYADSTLDSDGLAELNRWLREDPRAPKWFRMYHELAVSVAARCKMGEIEKTTEAPRSAEGVPIYRKGHEPKPIRIRPAYYAVAGIAAALLVVCGLAVYLLTMSVDPQPDPVKPNQPGPAVATLIENTGDLTTPHGFPAEGEDFSAGEYTLSGGSAEFMLTNSVNVKLRGDTRMHMRNDMHVSLTRGSAEFICPTDAKGFTVHLPDGSKVVDRGTAFRVDIRDDGSTRVLVTEGRVDWTPGGDSPQTAILNAGHAGYRAPATASNVQPPIRLTASGVPIIDGSTLNGSFESGTTAATGNIDVWAPAFDINAEQRLNNNAIDGGWSALIGRDNNGVYGVVQNTGYDAQSGDTFNLSFDWAAAFNWDIEDTIEWSLFTTSDDTTGGAVTLIATGTVSGVTGLFTYAPTVVLTGIGTVAGASDGRDVWIQFYSPTAESVATEFARLDRVQLSVNLESTQNIPAAASSDGDRKNLSPQLRIDEDDPETNTTNHLTPLTEGVSQ